MSLIDADLPNPNFLIVGAQKAGSSSLHDYLAQHSEIGMTRRKELHYFDDFFHTKSYAAYQAEFCPLVESHRCVGESTPAYFSYPGSAEKIRALLGDIPILVILREPIARMYSQYWHNIKYGREELSFRQAVEMEEERRATLGMTFYHHFDYLGRSDYARNLANYQRLFSKLHISRLEELASDPTKTLNDVFAFLGVETQQNVASRKPANEARRARVVAVNRMLNNVEDRFGPNRMTGRLRRMNFAPTKYPPISDADREYATERLNQYSPDTARYYGAG